MKKLNVKRLLLLFVVAMMQSALIEAHELPLHMTPGNGGNEEIIYPSKGNRLPSPVINATITAEFGVSIPGVEKGEILTYEAYDEAGECMAVFSDEESFVDSFFSVEGIAMVKFTTASYIYTGWL